MDIKGNKIVLQPRRHRIDLGIFRVIGRGLEVKADEQTQQISEEEQSFADRVQEGIKRLNIGEWKRAETFEISRDEAPFAVSAIRDNSVHELLENNARLREMNSFLANNERPKIEAFAKGDA